MTDNLFRGLKTSPRVRLRSNKDAGIGQFRREQVCDFQHNQPLSTPKTYQESEAVSQGAKRRAVTALTVSPRRPVIPACRRERL